MKHIDISLGYNHDSGEFYTYETTKTENSYYDKMEQEGVKKMNKQKTDPILEYIKEQTNDILGYAPNENDLDGVLTNILDDMQDRIVEYTDFIKEVK